eukprot:4694134-Amphidinium_carterae.3
MSSLCTMPRPRSRSTSLLEVSDNSTDEIGIPSEPEYISDDSRDVEVIRTEKAEKEKQFAQYRKMWRERIE